MSPKIEITGKKYLVGIRMEMSLIADQTPQLFGTFMPKRNAIPDKANGNVILAKFYSQDYFSNFNPSTSFTKMAAVEVNAPTDVDGFESIETEEGLYAIFEHTGGPGDSSIFEYIFREWLPQSAYELDNRPHFDIMPADYFSSEVKREEILIPIKADLKNNL